MKKDDFKTEQDFNKFEIIKAFIDKIKKKSETHYLFNNRFDIIKGDFVFDMYGRPGAGIKELGTYDHLFGKVVRVGKKDKARDLIEIVETEEQIRAYFNTLKMVEKRAFKSIEE